MRDAFARTVYDIAQETPNVFVVVADISPASAMAPFLRDHADRFINVGLCEQAMIGASAGLALRGCTVFAYTIATFAIYRPFEQVRDDLCYQNVPVTVVGIGGGVQYSLLGGTHHAQEDIAVMSALPGMSILAPCDPLETAAATWACARHSGPVYLRLGKAGEPNLTSEAPEPFVFGQVRLIRPGADVAILSYGPIMRLGREVAEQLTDSHGCSPALFSVHTLKPLDTTRLRQIFEEFRYVVVIEEHSERGGLAVMVKALAFDAGARCEVATFSLRDEFIHAYGTHADLLSAHGITVHNIVTRVAASLK